MQVVQLFLAILAAAANFRLARGSRLLAIALTVWTTLSLSIVVADALRVFEWLPAVEWVRALGICWFVLSGPFVLASALWRRADETSPDGVPDSGRRLLLRAASSLAVAPAAGLAFAIREAHRDAAIREIHLPVANLSPDLEGLLLVQISDIHLSPFFSRDRLRRAVEQANELRADIGLITGDLITSFGDPLQEAITELARLRTTAGLYGCLGNHEVLAQAEEEAARLGLRHGIRFFRSEAATLRFGNSRLNLAGVDYQRMGKRYLSGAETLLRPDMPNLLLSHNPDVFPVAARQGWDLTIAGHTHGGQIQFEYLHASLNPARFSTPFTYGEYRMGTRGMFVSSGLGTIGIPARLGTRPEIALIRLVRA